MPLRIAPFRAALHSHSVPPSAVECDAPCRHPKWQHAFFSTTSTRRDDVDGQNHYETLKVKTDASPADIKKSFYQLSKTHHPDHNPDDPEASRRFTRISEAYTVLSHTDSRTKYDRDVLRLHERSSARHSGSYYSSSSSAAGPAGARPASGLSRRRTTFQGPPPSFYRSGGWGAHSAKRSAAHEESTGGGGSGTGTASWDTGGMGPGQQQQQQGQTFTDIPHFDRAAQAAHTRTQARVFRRAAQQANKKSSRFPEVDGSSFGGFFAVLGVLGGGILVQYIILSAWGPKGGKEVKLKKKTGGEA